MNQFKRDFQYAYIYYLFKIHKIIIYSLDSECRDVEKIQ